MACLTDNTVAAFLEGALPGERQDRVRVHLQSCETCRSLLAALDGQVTGQADDGLVGKVLAETYEVLERLGAGGMATVYVARHLRLERRVAVKVLSAELRNHGEAVERFAREARVCAALGSAHIATVFDFNRTPEGVPYIVIELLHGEDMAQRLALDGPMNPALVLDLLGQTCDGLAAAHAEGIIHRDIKPSNLYLCHADGPVPLLKVLDFGISKIKGQLASLTGTQQILGTPSYMSPEMARGQGQHVDARADLFSLGAVAYEALSGQSPFSAESIPTTLFRIAYEEPTPLAQLRPELPAPLCALVKDLLEKDPARRPASALEVKKRLGALLDPALAPTRISTARPSASPARPPRRSTPWLIVLGAAAVVTATGLSYLGWRHREAPSTGSAVSAAPVARQPDLGAPALAPTETQGTGAGSEPAGWLDAGTRSPPRRSPARRTPIDNDPLL